MTQPVNDITIRHDRRAGDDALIVDLHVRGYRDQGPRFADLCAYVTELVADTDLDADNRSRVWFAERDGQAVACAAMIDRGARGQLRWVIVVPEARGLGLGRRLVETALQHARDCGWRQAYLETTDGLDASMGLYHRLGFEVVSDEAVRLWHGQGRLIVMTLDLSATPEGR